VQNYPEVAAGLQNGSAVATTIDAYLIHRLTDGAVLATDSTNASRTLLFNINTLDWDDDLCSWWQVPRGALPEVRDSGAEFGETDLGGVLPQPIPIRGVMGDSQASLLAQGCRERGTAKVTFGTGSSVLLNLGPKPSFSDRGVLTALAWTRGGRPTYAFEGIIIASASTLVWLRDQLGIAPDVATLDRLAQQVDDNGGVHLIPAFNGLGLPHWDAGARAAIVGLSSHSDRRHIARAGFESISFQVRETLDAMREEADVLLDSVCADGGPTGNPFLMQLTADTVGAALRVVDHPDGSALGAVVAGCWRDDEAEPSFPAQPLARVGYAPQPFDSQRLAAWQAAVQQVLTP